MPITIQQPTIWSPQAQQNYFEALMQKNRLQAQADQQRNQMIAQGMMNAVTPLQSAVMAKFRQDRADQRFQNRMDLTQAGQERSAAARMGMTIPEYQEFQQTGQVPGGAAARQSLAQQAAMQQELQEVQMREQIKRREEQKYEGMNTVREWINSGNADPASIAEYNRYQNELVSWSGALNTDPQQQRAGVDRAENGILGLLKKMPKPKTPAQQFAETVVVAGQDPATKQLVEQGVLAPGTAYTVEMRNGVPKYSLLDGQLSEKDKIELEIKKMDQQIKAAQLQSSQESDPHKDTSKKFQMAMDYLQALHGKVDPATGEARTFTSRELSEAMIAVEMGPEDHARKVAGEELVRSSGDHAQLVRQFVERAESMQSQAPGVTAEQLMIQEATAIAQQAQAGNMTPEMKDRYEQIKAAVRKIQGQ